MATYYVSHTGNNGAGDSWTNAKTTLAAGLALATADGDIVLVDHTHTGDNAIAADTAWAPPSGNLNCSIIAVNTGTGAVAEMGTSAWIGHSSNFRSVTLNAAAGGKLYLRGLTLRVEGSTADSLALSVSNENTHTEVENCYLWQGNTTSTAGLNFGLTNSALSNSICALLVVPSGLATSDKKLALVQRLSFITARSVQMAPPSQTYSPTPSQDTPLAASMLSGATSPPLHQARIFWIAATPRHPLLHW
jgi:hypothetical protein